ncbi:4225_t:CDS:10 [Funneliformis mosseae]|uniref:ubiquitinyl hydrolase 1 n=1 Tax=Funneliformis mosseae TaxID=27381 RepID=A0A9N9CRY3_FUNMO|nr:4225_t:CDS:10 [Funneliformis mosseae]
MQKFTTEEIKEEIEHDDDTNQEIDYISLFAKENKDFEPDGSESQRDTLSNSLNALQKALSEERNVSSRQLCKAIWHPAPISKAMITVSKGSHFHNMGHAVEGKMWLYPEECLFLTDRCSLSIQCHDVEMSLQHAYCEMIGGWLTLEKYQVYSYLKRIGFTVLRTQYSQSAQSSSNIMSTSSLSSQMQSTSQPLSHTNSTSHQLQPQRLHFSWLFNRLSSFIISPFIYITNLLNSSEPSTTKSTNNKEDTADQRGETLVGSGECETYEQVYKKLQIIESSSITHSLLHYNTTAEDDDYNIDFLVYKESAPVQFNGSSFEYLSFDMEVNKKRMVYHERQRLFYCGQFQDKVFTNEQLNNVALKLAEKTSSEFSTWSSYFVNPHKSVFGVGNYDINVLEMALREKDLEIQWFDVRKDIRSVIQFTDKSLFGLILNIPTTRFYFWTSYHWIAIKPFQYNEEPTEVYNLDSKLYHPEKFENLEEVYKFLESALYHKNGNLLLVKKKELNLAYTK